MGLEWGWREGESDVLLRGPRGGPGRVRVPEAYPPRPEAGSACDSPAAPPRAASLLAAYPLMGGLPNLNLSFGAGRRAYGDAAKGRSAPGRTGASRRATCPLPVGQRAPFLPATSTSRGLLVEGGWPGNEREQDCERGFCLRKEGCGVRRCTGCSWRAAGRRFAVDGGPREGDSSHFMKVRLDSQYCPWIGYEPPRLSLSR